MSARIEAATGEDCEALAALVNSAYRGDSSRAGWTTEADYLGGQRSNPSLLSAVINSPGVYIYCLREAPEGPICACVQVETKAGGAELYFGLLTVEPKKQASGLGRKLLEHVEELGRRQGAKRIFMSVIQIREELIAWYQRRGYQMTGERRPFPYGDADFGIPTRSDLEFVILEKRL